ncbi:MAG: hypothetical protein II873_11375 [Oscillospiraceae bacterium]|nr:hypothetical protein [Oscillospiraceae bacterium]
MEYSYSIDGYLFVKSNEDSSGTYYNIFHPDGRMLDRNHKFSSSDEMANWVRSRS